MMTNILRALLATALATVTPVIIYNGCRLTITIMDASTSFAQRKAGETTNYILNKAGLVLEPKEYHIPTLIQFAAHSYGIHPELLNALIHQESRHNPAALSHKGAIGLTQIMPFNAKRCDLPDATALWHKRNNVMCGARILSEELKTYKGDIKKALQAYNGGPKCLNKCSESIKYAENVIHDFARRLVFAQQQ